MSDDMTVPKALRTIRMQVVCYAIVQTILIGVELAMGWWGPAICQAAGIYGAVYAVSLCSRMLRDTEKSDVGTPKDH